MKKFVLVSSTSDSKNAVVADVVQSEGCVVQEHQWVTVINPTNHRLLLQACDDCGVVKSENSVLKRCHASKGQGIVSRCMASRVQLVS